MQGNIELAANRLDAGSDIASFLDRAQKASTRGATLNHRLLAFSRKQTLMPDVVDVSKLLSDMIELMRRTLGSNIEIDVIGDGDLLQCDADPGQLENAILNLAINARDAMGGWFLVDWRRQFLHRRA